MTFTDYNKKSISNPRVLIELDIGAFNTQWVNIGAGIWYVNFNNSYTYVDSTLLDYFTTQSLANIGSVLVDGVSQQKYLTLLELTANEESFYYDYDNRSLYVHLINSDEPVLHNISLGVTYGYSFTGFTPKNANDFYEGRLIGNPAISKTRDPLFYGKIQYGGLNIDLINADGYFDTFGQDNDIYGNEARVYFGYEELDYNDYVRLFTGYIESVNIGEEIFSVSISDRRKQLTKPIQYSCTAKNALDAIVEILETAYGITYNSNSFNTTEWAAAQAVVKNITIDMQEEDSVINVIQDICTTVFGIFIIDAENKYSFKVVDTSATSETTIFSYDILNKHQIQYDPSEVISSAKIGYSKDWGADTFTYLTDTTQEEAVFLKYKTYNQKTFDTLLTSLSDAQDYSDTILGYNKDVHATGELTAPMKYYTLDLTDIADIELNRSQTEMIGTKKSEIISIKYDLRSALITLGYRVV